MPTYEYECGQCGHTFELLQSMKDDPIKDCPACEGKGTVKRLIGSGAGLIFKGSGFYITDYKNSGDSKGGAAAGKGDTKGASATDSKSGGAESKSDSGSGKSESKSESSSASTTESKSTSSAASKPAAGS